ncbi:MAG: ABC transporter ATP-binding protein [Defluviitoga tunisiensis]|jgi:ATP-binding cassette subfamily B multidrug efflux pump|uniref:ABC-type multidrug transporter n=1 Tax=Defluviitoga tunisiensis TaxID=1006576 RepID=A0A0C7NME2_DEFTU|nr:ABC transporter ATP-binding protein [Defluviitoga tunisiensis]MDY0379283.1 ABC transporter ATP-binding protein [Defluviitoga tunisiensis]CEP79071.1 ABC-type multidrug transporter [Defluviitoga tunisiensis]HOB55194.1 ABC transporter ATP-binding protein [Defluviitoga tunisiensis]HOK16442.1 ABC transporter ATP-binding protein [Defluviitoga tunisiensis]HOL86672.1 ABC transporter ATP-binding protein [Defluviitoga tunisiensis]
MSQANEQKNDQKKKPIRQGFGGGRGGVGAPIEKPRNFMGSLKRLLGYLKPQLIPLIIVIVFAVVSTIFMIIAPKMLGKATNVLFEGIIGKMMPPNMTKDQAIEFLKFSGRDQIAQMLGPMNIVPGQGVNFSRLATILLTLLGVYALSAFFNWLQQYLMAGVAQKTVYNLRKEVDEKLARLPLKFYDSHPHGDLLSRVTNDIDNIGHTLQQTLVQLITAVVTVIGVLIMMLTISPLLTLITLTVIPLALLVTMFVIKHSQKQFEIQWDSTGELNGHVEESYTGFNVIKAFNKHWDMQKEFDEENERLREATFKAQFVSSLIRPFIGLINNLNYVIVSVVGGLRVANGVMTLGDIQAFIQYSRQFTMPIVQTSSIINVLQSTVASAERVFELLDEEEEIPDPENPVVLDKVEGHVKFENVYFSYEPQKPLIENLNLEAKPGQSVAIVGPTGAGKTTLVNLLMRFYDVDAGRITLDGVDIRQMRRADLRKNFGMVLQDAWLFRGTIKDNIAYGKEGATDEEIVKAAQAAYVDYFIRTLPKGYDTIIDEDATNLSQGQRQLITIARAFLANPPLLILDEATSSVDTRTEVLIQEAMNNLMEGRTSFVIAHRLSTIRNADIIVVMNHGRVVEQGNHKELMAKKGFYYDLYMSQFIGTDLEIKSSSDDIQIIS